MEVKKKTYQILSIIFLGISIVLLVGLYMTYTKGQTAAQQQQTKISKLQSQNGKLQAQYTQLKADKLKKYSANNLNQSSMNVKTNVDDFFKAINNWTGDNYATRGKRAKQYATEDVVKLFIGGTDDAAAAAKQAAQLKANDTSRKISDSHWYIEKTSGEKVNGLYIVTTETSVQKTNKNRQRQIYLIGYSIPQQKITSATPVDLSNGSLDNLGK